MFRSLFLLFAAILPLLSCRPGEDAPRAPEPTAVAAPAAPLPDAALAPVREAMDATEAARALLARDAVEGLPEAASAAAAALKRAAGEVPAGPAQAALSRGVVAAERLAASPSAEAARGSFADLSAELFALAAADPRLQEGWRTFRCPMVQGFPKWFQRGEAMENPYMGQRMLACGVPDAWAESPAKAAEAPADPSAVAYWTCPMHPSVKAHEPSQCPICGMDLTPVTEEALRTGTILVDDVRRQELGIRTAPVARGTLSLPLRAVGAVTYDASSLTDVTVRVEGFVERLHADEPGQRVRQGEPLFSFYSPELYATQQELLQAESLRGSVGAGGALAESARRRLELWGMSKGQIDAVIQRGEPLRAVSVLAPRGGYVIEKDIVAGDRVMPGMVLYRIADLDRVWVEAQVYESDLPQVEAGQRASVTLLHLPGRVFTGSVQQVYPYLAEGARTGRVRVALDNPDLLLKPGMYADVTLETAAGERLLVPREAVIYTGPRRLVFVDSGEGKLQPREVQLGRAGADAFEVLGGLQEGEVVVTSGNFLVAAESRLRSATDYWGGGSHAP